MKLLYICQYFGLPENAAGTRSYDLATSFYKEGIDVIVITSNSAFPNLKEMDSKWAYIERDGLKIHVLNCPYNQKMSYRQRINSFLRFLFYASKKALSIKCDIVLATSTPLTVGVPALIKKWFGRTPFIFEVRDVWPEVPIKMGILKNRFVNWWLRLFEKTVYKNSSAIVPLSVGMEQNIRSRINLGSKKVVVIPNISNIDRFEHINLNKVKALYPTDIEGKKVILYCGTAGRVNGIDYLVDLAKITQKIDNSVIYCIFGKGSELEVVLDKAKETGTLNKTFFYGGSVAKDDLPTLYYAATMGCSTVINNPVLWDNSANKFFDTLAAGKPMMINHEGWQADTIRVHNCGIVMPPTITEESTYELIQYLNNPKMLKESGKNAKRLAIEEYSLTVARDKYLSIFRDALKNN